MTGSRAIVNLLTVPVAAGPPPAGTDRGGDVPGRYGPRRADSRHPAVALGSGDMSGQVQCANCGAVMVPQETDARVYACPYCRAQVQMAIDAGQIAAGMQIDLANADVFLAQVARALSGALAENTRIQQQNGYVMHIEVNLEPDVFLARREGQGVLAQHKR